MTEATGFEAKTIHWLLEVDPKGGGFKRGDDNPLDCDLLVVDEASMVDVMLMQALMKAQSAGRRLHSRAQPRLTKCSMLWGRRGDVDLLVDPLRHPRRVRNVKTEPFGSLSFVNASGLITSIRLRGPVERLFVEHACEVAMPLAKKK